MQRSASCRSRLELSNAYLLAKFGFDTAENELFQVCPLSAYRSPRFAGLAPTLQGKVSKEEQNSDDPQTPTRAEPEADPDVFLAPTLQEKVSKEEQNSDDPPTPTTAEPGLDEDFFIALPSKPKSYSVNPILLTSPIASGDHSKEEQYSTFDLDLNSETSSQGSQVYCRTPSFSGNSSNKVQN